MYIFQKTVSLNIFYFQLITSYTVQYIQFIRKLGLERKRKLIEFFSYYRVHCDMERRTVSCVISICSQYYHTLTCQRQLNVNVLGFDNVIMSCFHQQTL